MNLILFALLMLVALTWLFIGLALYFLPVILAYVRKHKNILSITILTLFLGWTFLGWLAGLLWSLNCDVDDSID